MPVITVEAAALNKNQKEQMAKEFTEAAVKVMKISKDNIFIFIKENSPDNICVGGELLANTKH